MTRNYASEQIKTEWISALRGFAAILVFISHLEIPVSANFLFVIGRIGVVIFFLITGYLTYKSREKRNKKQYLINRFARMYPTFWIILLLHIFVFGIRNYSLLEIIANVTLFNEFVGIGCILGASWMMPIQIVFFFLVDIVGITLMKEDKASVLIILFSIGSLVSGVLRSYTGIPFPTAFPLLFTVSFLGIYYWECREKRLISKNKLLVLLGIFEVSLILSTKLSYDNWLYYIIAYNIGFLCFFLADILNIHNKALNRLGDVGFPFFLGASILYQLLLNLNIINDTYNVLLLIAIKFITALIFATFIHKYIERPILNRFKKIESQYVSN